jgi:hypothetical protein
MSEGAATTDVAARPSRAVKGFMVDLGSRRAGSRDSGSF